MIAIYRCYGDDGRLLYIGQARNVAERMRMHYRTGALWLDRLASITLEHHDDHYGASYHEHVAAIRAINAAEDQAIKSEWPLYNIKAPSKTRAPHICRQGASRRESFGSATRGDYRSANGGSTKALRAVGIEFGRTRAGGRMNQEAAEPVPKNRPATNTNESPAAAERLDGSILPPAATEQLPVAHVVNADGLLIPGRIWDPTIRAFLIAKVHEVRHRTGYGIERIMYALEAEGWHISRQTCWRFLHLPCDQCNGDTLNPADFHGRGDQR
jgi:hypothetical protein